MIQNGTLPTDIYASWEEELADFKQMGKAYFLY